MPDFFPFISYLLIATFTPGPNNIMTMAKAGRQGFRKALLFNAGVFTGVFVIIIISMFFSGMLLRHFPSVKPVLAYIGAGYILWLAYKVFKSNHDNAEGEDAGGKNYVQGVLMQFVNPKAILFSLTIVSSFIAPYYDSAVLLTGFAVAMAGVAFIATGCWALFGSVFKRILVRHTKIMNMVMVLLLVYAAVSLIL